MWWGIQLLNQSLFRTGGSKSVKNILNIISGISIITCCASTVSLADASTEFCKSLGGRIEPYLYKDDRNNQRPVELCWFGDSAIGAYTAYNFRHPAGDTEDEALGAQDKNESTDSLAQRKLGEFLEFHEMNNLTRDAVNVFFSNLRGDPIEASQEEEATNQETPGSPVEVSQKNRAEPKEETRRKSFSENTEKPISSAVAKALREALDQQGVVGDEGQAVLDRKKEETPSMITQIPNPAHVYCTSYLGGKIYLLKRQGFDPNEEVKSRADVPTVFVCAWSNSVMEVQSLFWGAASSKTQDMVKALNPIPGDF